MSCSVHFGARTACGQCHDSNLQHLRHTRAQFEQARVALKNAREALTSDWGGGISSEVTSSLITRVVKALAVIDEALIGVTVRGEL